MAKPHPRAELDQARLGRRRRRFGADPQPRRGHPHQRGIAERLGRRDKQQAPGLVGENFDSPAEILFDAAGYSRRGGQPKSAR